ncbi:MAG: prolyl oligopeptidase family serine peptidase [Acidimicrobiales bacterium]
MTDFPQQYATSRRFTLGAPRNVRVTPTGDTVLFLRSEGPTDPVLCLWALRVANGETEMLVDPKQLDGDGDLPPAELARRERARESAGGIVAYSLDESGQRAAFTLAGDLYVVDVDTGALTPIPTPGGVFDPVIDPTGHHIAFVGGPDGASLFIVDSSGTGEAVLVAGDDDPLVSWGRAEFIAGEEMSRTRGMWWSPDGTELLAQRTAEHDVPVWWIADPAHPDRAPRSIRYPAAGATNATVELARFTVTRTGDRPTVEPSGLIDWDTGEDTSFEYLANVLWAKGHPPLIVRQTRDQRRVELAEVGPEHEVTVRHTITDPTWVELVPGAPTWAGDRLLTVEDIDTARRLVVDGTAVSPDHLQVRSILRVDGDVAVVTVSVDDPSSVFVIELPLDGSALDTLPSIDTEPGVYSVVRGGSTVVQLAQRVRHAGVEITVASPSHPEPLLIADLSAPPVVTPRPSFFAAGRRTLPSALFLPADHDGSSKLPVLLDPYGGPHAQRVTQTHNAHAVSQWFADQGYAVLVTDGRGTPGRGPVFERAVAGDLAAPVLDDQIDALDAAADRFGVLDLERVGIRGWSFGGYLAALAALRRPDRIHAAVAGAPVTDWRLYDTHYTERYLGTPAEHPEHYRRCDLMADAHLLDRPLLLIHGLADDNVVAAHSLQLSTALLAAGRPHQVLPLSGVTHMTPQEVVAENLLRLQLDFLDRHLRSDQSVD